MDYIVKLMWPFLETKRSAVKCYVPRNQKKKYCVNYVKETNYEG